MFALFILLATACSKEPGVGGNSTITGKVIVQELDPFTGEVSSTYEAQEERVYIIYGDNEIFDDEIRTHYDGRFQFSELFKGSYTVYVYSDCSACPSGSEAILTTIEITENNSEVEISEDIIIKNL